MSNPTSPGNSLNLLRGRPVGSKNKRTLEGADYALGIVAQDDEDILVTSEQHEVPEKDGTTRVVSVEVEVDRHERAVKDPVYRVLRRQMRNGVGTQPGQLPPAVFNALHERVFGKVQDKVRVTGGRPLANETDDELRARLEGLAAVLGPKERQA